MNWANYQPWARFDIRVEREEYEHLFNHQARVLQDRLARRGRTDRTRQPLFRSGRKSFKPRRASGNYFIKQEFSAGAKRRDITTCTKLFSKIAHAIPFSLLASFKTASVSGRFVSVQFTVKVSLLIVAPLGVTTPTLPVFAPDGTVA